MTEAVSQSAHLTIAMKTKLKNSGQKTKTSVSVTPTELEVNPGQVVELDVSWQGCSNTTIATLKFIDSEDPFSDEPNDSSTVKVTSTSPSTPGERSTFIGTGSLTINENAKASGEGVVDNYILSLTIDGVDYSVDPQIKVRGVIG